MRRMRLQDSCVGLVLILTVFCGVAKSELTCQEGWFNIGGDKCYKTFDGINKRIWSRAAEVCESYGSHLVSIKDQYENNALGARLGDEQYWIGLNTIDNNELKWHSGMPPVTVNQGFWTDGQPDSDMGSCVYGEQSDELYVYDKRYQWSFSHCDMIMSFICQREAAPAGSFHCFSGGHVSEDYVCDGQGDCADSSDELDCPNNCHQHRTGSGVISLTGYQNSQSCMWAIETPIGTNAYVRFTSFNTESEADYVQVYSGSIVEIHAHRATSLSGTGGNVRQFNSYNNMILIKFSSDSSVNTGPLTTVPPGFSAEYNYNSPNKPEDHVTELEARDTVQAYTTDLSQAPNSLSVIGTTDYVYLIDAKTLWTMVTVEIESFELHDTDSITFYDGKSPDAPVLARICNTCENYNTVFSTGRYLSIYLRTERELTKNVGFSLRYRKGCRITTTDRYGVLFSPGFPGIVPYPNFMTCTWVINSDKPLAIYFSDDSVLQGDTFGRVNNGDYVEIYVGATDDAGTALHTSHGFTNAELAGRTFQSNNGKMYIRFTSSSTRNARGFMGRWSNDCEDPMYDEYTLVNGQVQAAGYFYTATNMLSCAQGYDFHQEQIAPATSQVVLECGYMGVWDSYLHIPRCTPRYCDVVPSINNGYIKSSTGSTYRSTATYECFSGSELVPAFGSTGSDITCQSNGVWSAPPTCQSASCTFSDISTTGGHLTFDLRHGDGTAIGSIVDYTCDAGYELVGEPILFCQADGTWSSTTLSCKKLTCLLPSIKNGHFQSVGLIEFQDTTGVICDTGYTYEGVINSVTCQADRTLTELPNCIDVVDCDPSPCIGGDCVETDGSFYCTCPSGYYLPDNQFTCLDVDECALGIDNCDHSCADMDGSYACSCDPGYTLYTADGTSGYNIPFPSEDGSLPSDTYHINHTCVLIECPTPTAIVNGQLLTNRAHHHYGDHIEYQCDLGYNPRSTVLTCFANKQWSGIAPTCAAAMCPQDPPVPTVNVADFVPGSHPYLFALDLNCTVGTAEFTKQRHCVYDRQNDEYKLVGAEYECGALDCGQPEAAAGSNYFVANTLYQSTFQFTCSLTQPSGTSLAGSNIVTCGADGYWNLGNLRCSEQACADPGYPAGGELIATTLADNTEVTFRCTRPGYELSHTTSMKCEGETWLGTRPTCIDTQVPLFTNCDNLAPLELSKYELLANKLNNLNIRVTDNTGIASFTISPSNANSTLMVENDGVVTYTAIDYAGNPASCNVQYVVIDETPPTVTCPQLKQIYFLDDSDTEIYTISDSLFSINDNSGEINSIEVVDRPQETFTMADVHKTFTYTVRVKDNSNNVATCKAQIFVTVRECSPLAFPTPLNAVKTCTDNSPFPGVRAYSCTIRCDDSYTLRDGKETTVTCNTNINSGAWTRGGVVIDWIPACVRDTSSSVISCPVSRDLELFDSLDTQYENFALKDTNIISELNDIATTTTSIDDYTFTAASLYNPVDVTVTVVDMANNAATCAYQYTAKPVICSPLSYPNVLNAGEPSCTRRLGSFGINPGYDCTITADPGYILRAHGQSTTVSCDDGSAWDEIIPSAIVDTTAPTPTCPTSRTVTLATEDDTEEFIMANEFQENVDYTIDDIGGVNSAVTTFSPPALTLNVARLYSTTRVVMRAYDLRGNQGTCDFDITVTPLVCSPLSLPTPRDGDKVCVRINGGYQCTLTCNPNFGFDFTTNSQETRTCFDGQPWTSVVTACTQTTDWVPTVYVGKYLYSYEPIDQTQNIPLPCSNHYTNQQKSLDNFSYNQMAGKMSVLCKSGVGLTDPNSLNIEFFPDMTYVEFVDDGTGNSRQANITYKFQMTSDSSADVTNCAAMLLESIDNPSNQFHLSLNIDGDTMTCPELSWISTKASNAGVSNDCFTPRYKSLDNPLRCVNCPLGSNSENGLKCNQCPAGRYRSDILTNSCKECIVGFKTRNDGSTSEADCVAHCQAGSYSTTGLEPCFRCGIGTYSNIVGAKTCSNCNAGLTTVGLGSLSDAQCVAAGTINPEQCPLGTMAESDGTCSLCPLGWYRSANSAQCRQCPLSTSTYVTGAIDISQCYGLCPAGMYSASGLPSCTACPVGTFWQDSTTCARCDLQPNRAGYSTRGVGATSINDCVSPESLRVACPRGTMRVGDNCVNCPIGEYQDREDQLSCSPCPSSAFGRPTSTYFEGASSASMCFDQCESGFWSDSGLSPCAPCGVGSYSLNPTSCETCGSGKTTATKTAGSVNECIDQCTLGQFSYSGYNFGGSCRNCPAHYYQDVLGRTDCRRCPSSTTYSILTGLASVTECQNAMANLCYAGRCGQNGGQCDIQDNTYRCTCPTGYFGRNCELEVRYCYSNPCYNGGICSETRDGHSCDCRGLASGPNCETVIETCLESTCQNGDCLNQPGTTKCLCRPGYSGQFCVTEQNICSPNPCENGGQCSDVSFGENLRRKCTCPLGFNGKNCENNIGDCDAPDTCLYGGACSDRTNDYFCGCPPGYGGKYCQTRVDRCAGGGTCGGGGSCVDDYTQDLPRCICLPGYQFGSYDQYSIDVNKAPNDFGTNIGIDETIDACRDRCTNDGGCTRFTYKEQSGECFIWRNEDLTLISTNAENTYTKNTVYPDDDFYSLWYNMDSPTNFDNDDIEDRSNFNTVYGLNICGGTVPLDAECRRVDGLPNQAGITCSVDGLACSLFTACADYEVRFKCAAHRVFLDNQCTQKTDYCAMSPCKNGAPCSAVTGDYRCTCLSGYSGKNCQTDIDNCAGSPCQNAGECTDDVDDFSCDCQPGWTGKTCVSRVTYCQDNQVTCSGNGQCENPPDLADYFCDCYPGYTGHDCETEIDLCDSSPCIHGAACVKAINGYRCDCVQGFYGQNCEKVVQNCPTLGSLCGNPATCHNIFSDYYCECPANTYGDNCEHQPDPCGTYNKCLNGGFCSLLADTTMHCSCPGKYGGAGCEELLDHCGVTNLCQNDGTCSVTDTPAGYSCACANGYESSNCEMMTDNCFQGQCPGGTCYNDVGKYYCRCPLGKTGTNCARDFDRDYDLFFNHPYGLAFAWIPVWKLVENANAGSVSIWVRYTEDMGTGIFLTMFTGDRLDESEKFMEFMDDGIKVYVDDGFNDHMKLVYTRNFVLNDGNWHNVVFNYDMVTGKAYLIADTVSHTEIQNDNLIQPNNTYKFWTVLGCEFDQTKHQCIMGGNNFNGLLSQANWYHRMLHKLDDIPRLIPIEQRQIIFSEDTQFSDVLLVWNEYELESGVSRIIPSEAGILKCDNPLRTNLRQSPDTLPPCTAFIARQRPYLDSVTGCPEDRVVYSASRITSVTWTEPIFHDAAHTIAPEYQPGGAYHWGMYPITYIAVGANNNMAVCHFKVYVQRSLCENPPSPAGGGQNSEDSNPLHYKGNDIYCYSPNSFRIDRPAPELFTCDLTGTWNIDKPFSKFRYPACGQIRNTARVRIVMTVVYLIGTEACSASKTNAESRALEELVKMNIEVNYELCTMADCTDVYIFLDCASPLRRKKRQAGETFARLKVTIDSAAKSLAWGGEALTMEEYLTYKVLGADVFDFSSTIPKGSIEPDTFEITAADICPEGQVYLGGDCVECGPGNYYTNISTEYTCHDCPLGQYQDQSGMTSCKPCDSDETTEIAGSYRQTDCKKKCVAGEYFDNTAGDCLECPIGFYQELEGQFYCDFCLSGQTTRYPGSTSESDCKETCPSGQQLMNDGRCELCPIGQYRNELLTRLCVTCDDPQYITDDEGSVSSAACTVRACDVGTHLNNVTNLCEDCLEGTYQDLKWQTECISCGDPSHWTTDAAKSVSETDCKYYCPSGFEVRDVGICDICTVGHYKDNSENKFGVCVPCGGNLITPNNGSTSLADCSIYKCPAGYQPTSANDDCEVCPLGFYQPEQHRSDCEQCQTGMSTRNVASLLETDCEMFCSSGQEKVGNTCVNCGRGYYKDNGDGLFGNCTMCPDGYTTDGIATETAAECSVRGCLLGTRRNVLDTECIGCDYGEYQDELYQTSCKPCPSVPVATSTRMVNATSPGQCETFCSAGSEKTAAGACDPCDRGYYKDNLDGLFAECTLCPAEFITETTAATSLSDCDIGNCSAGFMLNDQDTCDICPKGTYQPNKWQSECFPCGLDKTTEFAGADDVSLCILVCGAGYEDIGGLCQKCARGYYKEIEAAAACTQCPVGYTTEDITGADDEALCSLPACDAGEYLDRTGTPVCMNCPYDTYQPVIWQESCDDCPSGLVTLTTGASTDDQCVANCTSGQEYNPSSDQCQICEIGFYRDQFDRTQTVCQGCPIDRITPSEGSTSVADCSRANCTEPGQYLELTSNTCEDCPVGTYNSVRWRTSCTPCQSDYTTLTTGNVDQTACRPVCVSGYYVNVDNVCEACPVGTYRTAGVSGEDCVQCPYGLLTTTTGAESESMCSISPCIAGEYYIRQQEQCISCPRGTYQPDAQSTRESCIDCPFEVKYTPNVGANNSELCSSPCAIGEEFDVPSETCVDCDIGYYQPDPSKFTCIQCPVGRRFTARTGASSSLECLSPCNVNAVNECSENATCATDPTEGLGYKCECFPNYGNEVGSNLPPGRRCNHVCDTGYCKNNAKCVRDPAPACICTDYYKGHTCQDRIYAEDLSTDDWKDIVIPVCIAVGALILLLIALVVCCLKRNWHKGTKPGHFSEFQGERVEKGSTHSFDNLGQRPGSHIMMAPSYEMQYDNQAFRSSDSAVYEA